MRESYGPGAGFQHKQCGRSASVSFKHWNDQLKQLRFCAGCAVCEAARSQIYCGILQEVPLGP